MYYYHVTVGDHSVTGFSMFKSWAKETVLLEVRALWKEYGWRPAEWRISWGRYCEEGGTLWRA